MPDAQTPPPDAARPPYRLAGAVALGAFMLYALTLAPTTQFWDASEYITAAYVLGIPHPPGNPLFVILAHAWGLLPLAADYGARINLLTAATSAAAVALCFLLTERWLVPVIAQPRPRRLTALAGTLCGATAFTVWNQSVANEKVYTLSVLSIALVLWLVVRWGDRPDDPRRDRYLVLIAYLLALTSTNHQMGLLVAPAVLVFVLATDPRALLRPRVLVPAAVAAIVGLSVVFYLPIRAHFFPYLNEGEPTTWPAFWAEITRAQFGKPSLFDNPMYQAGAANPGRTLALYVQQLLNYVQYFTWQFGHDWPASAQRALAVVFAGLGVLGAHRQWRAERRAALAMTALMVTLTLLLVFYLNFRWGYSQPYRGAGLEHEVRERDYFFIASFALWGIWIAHGLAALMEWVRERSAAGTPAPARSWAVALPILLVALVPLAGNRLTAPRAGETLARDFGEDVLQSVDPYALVVTAGDNDTFPLWYAQGVRHVRPDVSVLVLSLANLDWYLRQLQRRNEPPPEFDAARAPALYRGRAWPRPTTPWMSRFYLGDRSDSLPDAVELAQPVAGYVGPIAITLDPARIGRRYLLRADLAILQMIKEQLGKRPIYFAGSTGDYADRMGLGPYLVTEGLVRRLEPRPVAAGNGVVPVRGLGFVNIARTRALAFDVYRGGETAARRRPRGWVDLASQNSLLPYALMYDTLAAGLQATEPALALRAARLRDAILANTSFTFDAAAAPRGS